MKTSPAGKEAVLAQEAKKAEKDKEAKEAKEAKAAAKVEKADLEAAKAVEDEPPESFIGVEFASLELTENTQKAIQEMGFKTLTEIQARSILPLLRGQDHRCRLWQHAARLLVLGALQA